jgi:tRNA-dihydrouridine synthase A
MMDWTDRHDRYLLRLITRHAWLYTEMVTTGAILHGDRARHLDFSEIEHPVALQLGGSDPNALAECARLGEQWGYDEINLNCGCPSDRVQSGRFGACLMKEPQLVADCVQAMRAACTIPVTVKSRIGVDDADSYEALHRFVGALVGVGCRTLIVHARKAWLQGLSPKENREIPPLQYDVVYRLRENFPALELIINGGIKTVDDIQTHLQRVDGVMIGREAYHNPYALSTLDAIGYGDRRVAPTRLEVLAAYTRYIETQLQLGIPLQAMTRHVLGLFQAVPGARAWRRYLSENAHRKGAGIDVMREAQKFLKST